MTNTETTTRDLVYLAGLLHDIGKFYQRADTDGVPTSHFISSTTRNAVSTYCPPGQYGGNTHKHVIWTLQFFEDFDSVFADALTQEQRNQVARLASAHHKPNRADVLECVIQKADHYSSGIDRTSSQGLTDEFEEIKHEGKPGWDAFKNVRIVSIFETLLGQTTLAHKLPVAALQLDPSFFPKSNESDFTGTAKAQYQSLWAAFSDELTTLGQPQNRPRTVSALAETMLYLLEKYATTVPSSTQHLPDVSLFDHLKSTAALSLCLHDYLAQKNQLANADIRPEETPLLLIGGDLSGIQAFIYDIIGRSAAKNLKGRSFYLQLMVDSIVQYLLDGLGLFRGNVVYSSGGGFYILAPNTDNIRNDLARLQATLSEKLRIEQGVQLFLAVDSQPVSQGQIFGQTINEAWSGLTEKLAAKKRRRFAESLTTDAGYRYFFEPGEAGGESRNTRDAVTGEEFLSGEETYPFGQDEEDADLRVRKTTFEQVRLGRTLRENIQYVVMSRQPITYWEPDYLFEQRTERYFEPLGLGLFYSFVSEKQLDKLRERAKGSVDNVLILSVNSAETTGFALNGNNQTYGFTFYGGNDLPRDTDQGAKFFDELAGPDSLNFKRLGVLRMDVDNLGFIFKNGFDPQKRTFSRYSTLSRMLDYFFKGYLNRIRLSDKEFIDYTFILYAGGDDLFIVGKWDVTLRFAERIQQEFANWTCHNPRLGLSGGVAVVPPRFPIAKAADQSAGEEKRAKNHQHGNRDKNSLSLFGTPLGWGHEWQMVTDLKNDLKHYIGTEKSIPKALISKISTLHTMKQQQEKDGQNPSWRWLSAYDLGRASERAKSGDAKAFFNRLKTDLFTNKTYKGVPFASQYTFLDLLNVAARWAELEMRSEDKQID